MNLNGILSRQSMVSLPLDARAAFRPIHVLLMSTQQKFFCLFAFVLVLLTAGRADVTAAPDPVAFGKGALANPNLADTDGELFCWNASGAAADFLRGYEASGDVRWLEEAERYYDFLLGKLTRDPDGNEGWIGLSIWGTPGRQKLDDYRIDAVVGDAILLAPMVGFAEIVKKDPALAVRFGASAERYLEKARTIGWEKWNHRGAYYRDGAGYGSYQMPARFISKATGQWVAAAVEPMTENLNKHSAMAIVMLRLWRTTGEMRYRLRAEEIFSRLKSLFRYLPEEDRVIWNFWMPHAPLDIRGEKLASWVGLHPQRANYQAEEVARIVEAYDSGIVFDGDDLRRLIRTNHFMMPATSGGKWRTADGSAESGKVWSSLARFDPKIRDVWRATLEKSDKPHDKIELAYDDNVTAQAMHWGRRYVKEAVAMRVFYHPPQPGAVLSATVVIPNAIRAQSSEGVRLVTQTKASGELTIDLLDKTGRAVLGELYRRKVSGDATLVIPSWDGANPRSQKREAGEYIVRWRLNGEIRTEKVWVTAEKAESPPGLEAGEKWLETIAVDASDYQSRFVPEKTRDGDLETRWTAPNDGPWIRFDFGKVQTLVAIDLAVGQGDLRNAFFRLEVSEDGEIWKKIFEGASGGKTAGFERFRIEPVKARFVRYVGFGNSMNEWNNLSEVRFVTKEGAKQP